MRYAELDIPRALTSYNPSLSSLSLTSFPLPCQDVVNWIRREIALAASNGPPFQPYLVPKLTENPWLPLDSDHSAALAKWIGFSKQAKRTAAPQELSIQAFTLYHLRFAIAADLCQAWSKFGGIGPQLSH